MRKGEEGFERKEDVNKDVNVDVKINETQSALKMYHILCKVLRYDMKKRRAFF